VAENQIQTLSGAPNEANFLPYDIIWAAGFLTRFLSSDGRKG